MAAHQAPPSLGFSRQEHWSGLPFPSPGNLPNPGIQSGSPALQADSLPTELQGKHSQREFLNFISAAAAAAKSLQSCPILCNPIDGSPPGSPAPGILQERTLEWDAISFSNTGKWKVKSESEVTQSCPTLSYPMDCSLPGSSIHGIFQARVLEWVAIAFSEMNAWRYLK